MVFCIERAGRICGNLGSFNSLIWCFYICCLEDEMNEILLFVFGAIATIAAIGPLFLAFILDTRSEENEE